MGGHELYWSFGGDFSEEVRLGRREKDETGMEGNSMHESLGVGKNLARWRTRKTPVVV